MKVQSKQFYEAIKIMHRMSDILYLKVMEDKLRMIAVDPSQIALVYADIPYEKDTDSERTIACTDGYSIYSIIKNIYSKYDHVSIVLRKDMLILKYGKSYSAFTYYKDMDIPKVFSEDFPELGTELTVEFCEFKNFIYSASVFSSEVFFIHSGTEFCMLSISDNMYSPIYRILKGTDIEEALEDVQCNHAVLIHKTDNTDAVFVSEYMLDMILSVVKEVKNCKRVKIRFDTNMPVRIGFIRDDDMVVAEFVAPRIIAV